MSRDRDPFDRAVEALRLRLRAGEGLQGRPLAINLLAQALGVSQTPVREALAWLAGEGLIVRTRTGYVGRTFEAEGLAQLYRLNLTYVLAGLGGAATRAWPSLEGEDPVAVFEEAVGQGGDRTLLAALRRVREGLAPFAPAEADLVGDDADTIDKLAVGFPDRKVMRAAAQGYFRRRARAASAILRATCERLQI